jgi:hypothetical protein
MGEAKRRKQLHPNYGKSGMIQIIAKTLDSFLGANTQQITVTAFTMLTLSDIVFINMCADAVNDEEKKEFGMRGNNPVKIERFSANDPNLPDIPDLQHLVKEIDFSKERILVMWFPDNIAAPNLIDYDKPLNMSVMSIALSTVETELARFKP